MRRRPVGVTALSLFFAFGAAMAGLSFLALLLPRTILSEIWRLNPSAHAALLTMGAWSLALMAVVSIGCALSAYGLWRGVEWGRRLALLILVANLLGDTGNAIFRSDFRALIGLPVAGLMVAYLFASRTRAHFTRRRLAEDGRAPEARRYAPR